MLILNGLLEFPLEMIKVYQAPCMQHFASCATSSCAQEIKPRDVAGQRAQQDILHSAL